MTHKSKLQLRHCPTRVRTAALVLLVLFAFLVNPAHADRGVAVGPYWRVEMEGKLTALIVDDLDGDGWGEIAAGTNEGHVYLWQTDGSLAWQFTVDGDWVTGLSTDDVDGDGDKEVIATAAGILPTSFVYVLHADGELAWSHSVRDELWGAHLLDVDDDGRLEMLLAARRPAILDDDGTALSGWPLDSLRTPHVQAADLDGDGAPEILAVSETEVTIIETDGTSWAWPHGLDGPIVATRTADLDGDGRDDVIIATKTAVALFQDDGRLVWTHPVEEPPGGLWAGDGLGVLVALGPAVVQLTAGGDEAWRFDAGPQASLPASGLDAADPDADGIPEIVVGTAGGQVYLLDAGGEQMAEYPVAGPVTLVRHADLNGDGRGEVLVGARGVLSVFGSPAGATATGLRWAYATRGAVTDLSAGDVDDDGRWEVVVGGRDKKVTLLDKEGALIWQFAAADVVNGVSAGNLGEVLVHAGRHLYLLAGDGTPLWQRTFKSRVWAVERGQGPTAGIAVGLEDGRAMLLDPEDGAEWWSHPFDAAVLAVSVTKEMTGMIVGLKDGRVARLDERGRPLWEQDVGRVVTWLAVADLDQEGQADVIARSADNVYRLQTGDGTIPWRTEAQAERLIGVALRPFGKAQDRLRSGQALGDGVVVGTDQRVYRLDATGAEAWSYPLDEVSSTVYAADLDGECEADSECGQAEVAVGTVKGEIYLLDAQGQLVWQGKGRERINAFHAADLNGDGRQELLVGMEDGLVEAYGLALNQVPWLSAPRVTPVGGGYVYSVQVHDPDEEAVRVTLEFWDPSQQAWRADQQLALENGSGLLNWSVPDPFDTWDSGRDSRFRFVYDDGHTQGTTNEAPGPLAIPTAPWYTYYGMRVGLSTLVLAIPVLGLLFYRRQRAYRLSPIGQAEALLTQLRASPGEALMRLHDLSRDDPALLAYLPGLARDARESAIADLSEGFNLILTRPEVAAEGLRAVVGAANEQRSRGARERRSGGVEQARLGSPDELMPVVISLYDVFLRALEANTVSRIVTLRPRLGGVGETLAQPDFVMAPAAEALADLGHVAQTLHNFERVETVEDKVAYLAQAIESLGRLDRQFRDTPQPEQNILTRIVANWLVVTTNALQDIQGRAQIEVSLRTRQLLTLDQATLSLELTNTGRSPASNVTVTLLPGKGYTVDDGTAHLDILPAGRSALVELPISLAPAADHFRAEFTITFDDRERSGKALAFADLVQLLRPATEFQPMPNPYAPGTPLRPGSPIFFGRDDLFQFIAENMAGLARQSILVLIGQRRMGKTSFLQQLLARLGEDYFPVYIDGQSLGIDPGMANFFYDLSLAIVDALADQGIELEEPEPEDFQERPSGYFERIFLPEILDAIGQRQLLLLFDEFEELEMRVASGKLEPTIFPYFRHLMQHGGDLGFIFVGTHRLEALSADYWSIFFNIALYKHITFLDEAAAHALIVEPVAEHGLLYDDLALDKMLRVTAGHPYFLQLTCHALVNRANREGRGYLTIQDVNDALGEMVELGEAHFAFLWEQSSPQERLALASLTRLLAVEPTVTAAQVAELLAERGVTLEMRDVRDALRRLVERDIVRELEGQPPRYEYKVDLVRLWVERYKALGRVVEEVG